jgi:hypothetical protein
VFSAALGQSRAIGSPVWSELRASISGPWRQPFSERRSAQNDQQTSSARMIRTWVAVRCTDSLATSNGADSRSHVERGQSIQALARAYTALLGSSSRPRLTPSPNPSLPRRKE